ncbi:hypothetical protein B6J11_14805 [Klebsiella pneumoniae]|nr:hypothetical protein B6J11_14805 [Klebsiella pneumoniae]
MAKVTRVQAGQYSVDDGRFIIKNSSGWLVVDARGSHDFGPVSTLAAAKQYVGGVSGNPRKFRHSALWNFLGGWSAA